MSLTNLTTTAEIRDYVDRANATGDIVAAIWTAAHSLIVDSLYRGLTVISERLHQVGLVGLAEDIIAGKAERSDFTAVLDAYDNPGA